MAQEEVAVAVYETHGQAEEAVKTLQKAGVDMKKLSIVGKDYPSASLGSRCHLMTSLL